MPHVSRIKLSKKAEDQLTTTLDTVLARLTHQKEMKDFLLALLTPTERIMPAKRLAIIILLKEGLPESTVANVLHVTRVTVSRMQLFLEARGEGYEIAMKKIEDEKALQEIKNLLTALAVYSVRAAGGRL